MPVPASDAIASDVGHGEFGLRTDLRPFSDLLSESSGQRHVWAELRPTKFLGGTWTAGASGTYRHDLSITHDGQALWPVSVLSDQLVVTIDEPVFLIAESLSRCEGIIGSFFYDVANGWLWIHPDVGADPADSNLAAQMAVPVGSHGVFQPLRGRERLTNGLLEDWTVPGTPDNWSVAGSGGTITLAESTDSYEGESAAKFTAVAAGSGDYYRMRQALLGNPGQLAGERFRFSGVYRISETGGSLVLRLFLDNATNSLEADGVSVALGSVAHFAEIGETGGEWRRFSFDLLGPVWDASVELRAHAAASSTAGTVEVDGLRFEHVPRMQFYQPMLSLQGVPQIEAARPDSFYGQISRGLGSMTLLNGGGFWESLFAELDWINAEVIVRVGGRFSNGGDEIPLEACPVFARGRVDHPEIEDERVVLRLADQRDLTRELLPLSTFDSDTYPNLPAQDRGRPRALILGVSAGQMRPTLRDIGAAGLGKYEICDPSYTSAGEDGSVAVYAYIDEQAALKEDATRRKTLSINNDYVVSPRDGSGLGRLAVLQHITPILIDEENRALDFDIGGSALTSRIAVGLYTPRTLATALAANMNSVASVADITVTLSTSTHKITIAKGAGTLNLRSKTGSDRDICMWKEIGFDMASDRTGSLSYVGDRALFADPADHIIRLGQSLGICDDSSGTYTGTAFRWISYQSEIIHYLLGAVFKLPSEQVDGASFVAARADGRRKGGAIYLSPEDRPITFADVIERVETGSGADIRIVDGVWSWVWRESTAEAGIVDLVESDYLDFGVHYEAEDVYETIALGMTPNPVSGRYQTVEATDERIRVRFGQKGQRTFFTTLSGVADATARLIEVSNEAQVKRRRFRFSVKGKALLRPVGSQLRLTRSQAVDSTGALSNLPVRIVTKRDNFAEWRSDIEAIEIPQFWKLGVSGRSELGLTTRLGH
jgi:hypothetical protein